MNRRCWTLKNLCLIEGCDRPIRRRGKWCSLHGDRYYHQGDPLKTTRCPPGRSIIEKLEWHGWDIVQHDAPYAYGPCWEIKGRKNQDGYGQIKHEGRYMGAHRWSYTHHVGPIPKGLLVRHKCDNPPCINPDHLEVGTIADNMADARIRGGFSNRSSDHLKGERNVHSIMSDERRKEMKHYYDEGHTYRETATKFGVSYHYAYRTVRKLTEAEESGAEVLD